MTNKQKVCPLCLSDEYGDFKWSEMLQTKICWLCAVELSADFYSFTGRESNYFVKAAKLLGLDEWECRKRYLRGALNQISSSQKVNAAVCHQQIMAIEEYQTEIKGHTRGGMRNEVYNRLLDKLKADAFGYDFDGITVVIK